MAPTKAHQLSSDKYRTDDVKINENVDFKGLLLSEPVLQGLTQAGFVRPSPIQLQALPLGRCGLDLIVQAKSGTGKTCVFTVIALESIVLKTLHVQVLVLAPTREIAVQIAQVVITIGSCLPGLRCYAFIGGIQTSEDIKKLKRCHIAVGTPGRVKQLIDQGHLKTDCIRLFVLDEADKLLDESFQQCINCIYSSLPEHKQMMALSATYPEVLAQLLTRYMQDPTFVRLSASDPALLGVKQFYDIVPFHPLPHQAFDSKVAVLLNVLNSIAFNQCLVFSNYQTKAQTLSDLLVSHKWASVYISGSQDQQQRMQAMDSLQRFRCRILISTDLTARGIDVEHVNLIINMDVPWDTETYLHRIGRAGRFGTAGLAITIASAGKEEELLKKIKTEGMLLLNPLPKVLDNDIWKISENGSENKCAKAVLNSLTNLQSEYGKVNNNELQLNDKCASTASSQSCESINANSHKAGCSTNLQEVTNNGVNTSGNQRNDDTSHNHQSYPNLKATKDDTNFVQALVDAKTPTVHDKSESLPNSASCPNVEFENGFLSDVSKQLEGIQRQLLACTQQYHERVDPIRSETPKPGTHRRISRRNSRTELLDHTSSSDEDDRGRPSVRKQKRKRSKSRKGSQSRSRKGSQSRSRRGSRSRRSSIGTDKSGFEIDALSSDSNIDESLAVLADECNDCELNEQVIPKDVLDSVIRNRLKESMDASSVGISFKIIADELNSLLPDCSSTSTGKNQTCLRFNKTDPISLNVDKSSNISVYKCVRPSLEYVVNHGCNALSPNKATLVEKFFTKQQSLFHNGIKSLLQDAKKKAKEQVLMKKLQEHAQKDESSSLKNEEEEDWAKNAEKGESNSDNELKSTIEKDFENLSVLQKLTSGLPKKSDLPVLDLSSAEIIKPSSSNYRPKDQKLLTSVEVEAIISHNRERGFVEFAVSDDSSTALAASSTDSDSEDDEAASGETSSDSDSPKSAVDHCYMDVGASGDTRVSYSQSNVDLSSRDYWNHHQIGDWEAYWKSYHEWTNRGARPSASEKPISIKQFGNGPATSSASDFHQCSHCQHPSTWDYYYNTYYSWNTPSYCQVCQSANRWSEYYGNQQASAAWWNYYWKYQQWQGYVEQMQQHNS